MFKPATRPNLQQIPPLQTADAVQIQFNSAVAGSFVPHSWLFVWALVASGAERLPPGFPDRSKEKEQQGSYMMFLVLPSHSAQIFPFL